MKSVKLNAIAFMMLCGIFAIVKVAGQGLKGLDKMDWAFGLVAPLMAAFALVFAWACINCGIIFAKGLFKEHPFYCSVNVLEAAALVAIVVLNLVQ